MTPDEIERKARAAYAAALAEQDELADPDLEGPWEALPERRKAIWRGIVQGDAGVAEG